MQISQISTRSTAASRVFPLDVLKALSILAVIFFHAVFVHPTAYAPIVSTLDILLAPLRFCVPVFLTISFFLMQRGIEKRADQSLYSLLKKRLLRLLIPTVFWFGIALLIRKFIWFRTKEELLLSLFQGTIYPGAYYLLILLQLVPLFIWFHPWFNCYRSTIATLVLQGIVFLGVYVALSGNASGILQFLENLHRPFFIYWFAYVALGTLLYRYWSQIVKISQRLPIQFKALTIVLTGAIAIAECKFLIALNGGSLAPYEYMMFSCILSVFVYFLCFASITEDRIPSIGRKVIQLLSTYSLGIYCLNGVVQLIFFAIFVKTFPDLMLNLPEMLVMKVVGFFLLLSVSLGLSLLLDKLGGGALVR